MSDQAVPDPITVAPDPDIVKAQKEAAAEQEYQRILAVFDVEQKSDTDKKTLISAIIADRITFDEGKEELTYTLARPVEQKNLPGGYRIEIVFREPTSKELGIINRGMKIAMNVEGEKVANMDMGDTFDKTIRFLTQICGLDLGIAWKLKARDLAVAKVIVDFFG